MNIIIPIGGMGQRFKEDGYVTPKPLINVLGEPMICRLIEGLNTELNDVVHIIYSPELNSYNFEDLIKFKFPKLNINFICLEGITRGASETILFGLNQMDSELEKSFIILDCDTFYSDDILGKYRNCKNKNTIFYFKDTYDLPLFSYIKIDGNNRVTEIKEKVRISDNANTGAYGFKSGIQLKEYCKKISTLKSELYTSFVYESMINDGIEINSERIEKFSCVGTPLQLKIYCESNKSEKIKKFCFDLDNTLVSYPKISGDYSTVEPIKKNIEYLRFLKESGHYIIVYTARRMKTHKGNVGSVISDIGKVTIETLSKFNIPHDELIFGKPHADFYIDDLGVNCFNQIDKILGFIDTKIEPRDFNTVEYRGNSVIKNTNNTGEVYWYNNAPAEAMKLFPNIISASDNTIEMEKIRGINYSYLYTNGALREIDIDLLISTLRILHTSIRDPNDGTDYHKNYGHKIKKRYLSNIEVYEKIKDSDNIFLLIIERIQKYRDSAKIKIGVIHGDPVFTNVFLTENGIKFIDPRGKIGDSNTIFGDVYYDFAKVYQSILGYDFILNDADFSLDYMEKIRNKFESNFNKDEMSAIKIITASLFFTLIPLHNFSEDKFNRYIKIIKSLL